MNITKPNPDKVTDKYALLQSTYGEALDVYNEVFSNSEGSFSTVSDNDTTSKFNVAIMQYNPTNQQMETINILKTSFQDIEKIIDPKRLNFDITKAMDNEICINRTSELGISKIIIHEDGVIGLSFIAYKGVNKKNALAFFEADSDFESLTYSFFS